MKTLLANIPDEIRSLPRWVCADCDSKIPMCPFHPRPASVSKPESWGDFDDASNCVADGKYNYVGFVFADEGYVGIDIDDAFDETGLLNPDVVEVINECRSYTEISRSGNGIHIIVKGDLPFKGRNNNAGWEIYKDGRYFLLTGNIVTSEPIRAAQSAIENVLEKHFTETKAKSSNENRKPRIWECEWELRQDGLIKIEPKRRPVERGGRHLAMVSLCGQLHNWFAHPETIYLVALEANERYMTPPLPKEEIKSIVKSVAKYRR